MHKYVHSTANTIRTLILHIPLLLLPLLLHPPLANSSSSSPQCNVIFHYNFERCKWNATSADTIANSFDADEDECIVESICRRTFKIAYIKLQPYVDLKEAIHDMLNYCCGPCSKLKTVNTFSEMSDTSVETLSSADFIYPFLGPTSAEQLHGFHFIPIFDAPSSYYITVKNTSAKETLFNLINACAELWPLLLICLLMALISGFVAWILETWNNVDEFPRPFYIGLFEGFWWSFISMTTVGYGDKSPKSWPARVFSIFWILIGITICSMFTASLTTEITAAMTQPTPEIAGNKIGWFQGRLYEATIIAQHGGTLVTVKDSNFTNGIIRLFTLLTNDEINGIVLDTYIFNLFKNQVSNESDVNYNYDIHSLIVNGTIHTEVLNKGEKLSFGMLVRDSAINHYFRKYFLDNHLQMEACTSLRLNVVTPKKEEDNMLFSVEAGVFWPFFAGTMGVLALITCFGVMFEIVRKGQGCCSKGKKVGEVKDGKEDEKREDRTIT